MNENISVVRPRLTTLRAGAVAGILFGVLFLVALVLIRLSVPTDLSASASWLADSAKQVTLALNLLPFAGIAFLWFMGVLRERVGALEDRFFATVFLGSGLLFLAMAFAAAAVSGGMLIAYQSAPDAVVNSGAYAFSRAATYQFLNVYGIKMAGVFMISTSTIARRTKIVPRWMAVLGYILAVVLILSIGLIEWAAVVLPLWVLMVSLYILVEDLLGWPKVAPELKPQP